MGEQEWSHPVFGTRAEFDERVRDVIALEQEGAELAWWFLSFATTEQFLGGLYIPAYGIIDAANKAKALGLNPGGEVQGQPITVPAVLFDAKVPESHRLRLLSKEELDAMHAEDKAEKLPLTFGVSIKAATIKDLQDALDEINEKLEDGFSSGFDSCDSVEWVFELEDTGGKK